MCLNYYLKHSFFFLYETKNQDLYKTIKLNSNNKKISMYLNVGNVRMLLYIWKHPPVVVLINDYTTCIATISHG